MNFSASVRVSSLTFFPAGWPVGVGGVVDATVAVGGGWQTEVNLRTLSYAARRKVSVKWGRHLVRRQLQCANLYRVRRVMLHEAGQ